MKTILALLLCLPLVLSSVTYVQAKPLLPYAEFGVTDRQAAALLLDRFAFGARPGEVERVVNKGVSTWWAEQLAGNLPEEKLAQQLIFMSALDLTARQLAYTYPNPGTVLVEARREGYIPAEAALSGAQIREKLDQYRQIKGYREQRDLLEQLYKQKIARAIYSENQLIEVLTDFWFNHFNVSVTDSQALPYILSYERDAIRSNILGKYSELLRATAKHPAMLYYLDNALSFGGGQVQRHGLNENYARELLELHTLGTAGGYRQRDVTEVARVFTGWTALPRGQAGDQLADRITKGETTDILGQHDFLFRSDLHDSQDKKVLGVPILPGGMDEGEKLLGMLARQRATAGNIANKLAIRFIADEPPPSVVKRLTEIYSHTDGDLRALLQGIVSSPEFWQQAVLREKIKPPVLYIISAVRSVDVEMTDYRALTQWMGRLGQPLYACIPPTGYSDRGAAWVNTGVLLQRMNFAFALARGQIPGVNFQWDIRQDPALRHNGDAFLHYATLMLPERKYDGFGQMAAAYQHPVLSTRDVIGLIIGSPEFQRY